jgi:chromosome segregation ATPase
MEQMIESLFQENKELRVHVGHLRDELNLSQQQSEARRQVICERDKLIQELNDQIAADEEELANVKASVEIQRGFREEMAEEIEALEKELAKSESESSQGMSAVVKFWEEAVREKNKAEERAEEYRIALMESDCRVDECEKRMDWLSKEVLEWKAAAEGYKNQYEELKAQKEADDKKSEEICTACNERYEEVLSDRNRLREEVALLTHERDTAVHENTEMMFYIDDLQEDHKELEANFSELEQVHKLWGEEIDRLRRVVTDLQTNRFTTDEFIGMLVKNFMPSADK